MGSRPPDSDQDLFWCKFSFGKCIRASSQSNHCVCCHWLLYKIHFLLQSDREMVHCCCVNKKMDDTSKMTVVLICGQLMSHPLFHFSNLLQMLGDLEWLMLSSLAVSRVVVRRSALMIALSLLLSTCSG